MEYSDILQLGKKWPLRQVGITPSVLRQKSAVMLLMLLRRVANFCLAPSLFRLLKLCALFGFENSGDAGARLQADNRFAFDFQY